MLFRTLLWVEAESVDDAAAKVADMMTTVDADPEVFVKVTTEGGYDPILHFASVQHQAPGWVKEL
jgi:hypothetical protein